MSEPPTPPPPPPGAPAPGDSVEQQLRIAEQRLAFHVENTPLAVIEWDGGLRITRWNAQAERVFGWSAGEVAGKALLDCPFLLQENRGLAERMMAEVASGRLPRSVVTVANRTKSGGTAWCEWYSSISYDESGRMASVLTLVLDVTGRRATAEALAQSQARVRAALDGARMLAWDLDLATGRWETTADLSDFFGLEPGPDYASPQMALCAVHPDDVPAVLAGRRRAVETGEPIHYEYRGRVPAADGRPRWFSTSGRVLRGESGEAVRIVAVTTDVTEGRRAEEKFRALLESAPDAMLIVDESGRIALANTQAERLFGYQKCELLGQPIELLVPEGHRAAHAARRAAFIEHPQVRPMGANMELSGRRKGGGTFPVEVSLSPLETGAGRYVISAVRDVSERKRAEAEREELDRQLREAQRWESLGVLAGGVAHDFNNILAAIQGSAGLARRGLPPGAPALGQLDQIEQACRRAAGVCRQMLAYAGHARSAGGTTDLAALVRESVPLLEVPAGPAAVRLDLAANLPPVPVDPAQVRQVLVSLATNAAEAIGGAGEITIGARPAEVVPGAADAGFQLAPPPGRYAVLTVSDTGCGMAPDVRARMFDPFFTTKFPGRGLGLAAALGIVRTRGGGLHVATAPGRGTIVSVYWPLPSGAVPAAPPPAPPAAAALVIDDEMYVREVTASTLQEMGYMPLLAADGPSGVELFRLHRDAIKLAVIDVVMPGMGGDEALAALRAMEPGLPAVLVSGLADRRAAPSPTGARTAFVLKPFHPEELMEAVRRLA
jgi:PAS domain S-box-containing protein